MNTHLKHFMVTLIFISGVQGLFQHASLAGTADPVGDTPSTVEASLMDITESYPAVGTVKPKSETRLESQIRALVKKVHVRPGSKIKKGDLLVTLDSRQAASGLEQAREALKAATAGKKKAVQAVKSAEAALKQARLRYERVKTYFVSNAATREELESAESAYLQSKARLSMAREALDGARAGIKQAREVVEQSRVGLEFTRIKAPSNGEIIQRLVEPGDLALPGKPLVTLRTESGFRIEAHVREGLINRVRPGMELSAEIATLGKNFKVVVEEIVPYADPDTRTFLIKAAIPMSPGLYPGMYARLLIPESQTRVVVIPQNAVIRTGQIEMVLLHENNQRHRRYITTGRTRQGMVEVLSGLSQGDVVEIREAF